MDTTKPTISIVIPTYNEADFIAEVLDHAIHFCEGLCDDYEIIVVDDHSADKTADIVEHATRRNGRIHLIRNRRKIGSHPSALVGLLSATKNLLVFLPVDLQIHPSSILPMVRAIDGNDMVIGVRRDRTDHALKQALTGLYGRAIRLFFGIQLKDVDGATIYRRELIREIAPRVDPRQPFIPVEIVLRSLRQKKRIHQVEIEHYPRHAGPHARIPPRLLLRLPLQFLEFTWRCYRIRTA